MPDRIQVIERRRVHDGYIVLLKFNSEWVTGWQRKPHTIWEQGRYFRNPVEAIRDFRTRR